MATYIADGVKQKFDSLSDDLKQHILNRNVQINNIFDLIDELDKIVKENE